MYQTKKIRNMGTKNNETTKTKKASNEKYKNYFFPVKLQAEITVDTSCTP